MSNQTAKVALTALALVITLRRYLDTPASRVVQSLAADRVALGLGLGIATLAGESETFTGPTAGNGRGKRSAGESSTVTLKFRTDSVGRKPRLAFRRRTYDKGNPADHPHDVLDVPAKPCNCCGTMFQPTVQRRMLCAYCFGKREENGGFDEHGQGT